MYAAISNFRGSCDRYRYKKWENHLKEFFSYFSLTSKQKYLYAQMKLVGVAYWWWLCGTDTSMPNTHVSDMCVEYTCRVRYACRIHIECIFKNLLRVHVHVHFNVVVSMQHRVVERQSYILSMLVCLIRYSSYSVCSTPLSIWGRLQKAQC